MYCTVAHFLLTAGWTLPSNCPLPPSHPSNPPSPSHLPPDDQSSPLDSPLPPQLPENLPDLSSRIHILLISTTGVLYQPISASLSLLGISNADASRLLRSLNIHSVRCAMSILKARRQLEHDPLTFANHPRYIEPLRPPPPVDPP